MRPLTLNAVLLMLLCISSCTASWQYITLDSHEVTKDPDKRFAWENDTLRMLYNYNGYGGPIWVSMTNKTDKPMYINWKKSAIIEGGYATSLFKSNIEMAGGFDATRGYRYTDFSSPMHFHMYFTFVIEGDNTKQFAVNHPLYAQQVMVASRAPDFFIMYKKHGDLLYVMEKINNNVI